MTPAVYTVAWGESIDRLGRTFASFRKTGWPLYAFCIGRGPDTPVDGIRYIVKSGIEPCWECVWLRYQLVDEIPATHALYVDADDTLCHYPIPPLDELLNGRAVGAAPEVVVTTYRTNAGKVLTPYLNNGIIAWAIKESAGARAVMVPGVWRSQSWSGYMAEQDAFNAVMLDSQRHELEILPCEYNYRPLVDARRPLNYWVGWFWPRTHTTHGVRITHNRWEAKPL